MHFLTQKLLLLPELGDFTLTATNSGPFKMANTSTIESLRNEVLSARILVSRLTASWTHVCKYVFLCVIMYVVFLLRLPKSF